MIGGVPLTLGLLPRPASRCRLPRVARLARRPFPCPEG